MGRLTELGLVAAAIACCALPILVASGVAGALLGLALRWWPLVLGAAALLALGGVGVRRRRAGSGSPHRPGEDGPP